VKVASNIYRQRKIEHYIELEKLKSGNLPDNWTHPPLPPVLYRFKQKCREAGINYINPVGGARVNQPTYYVTQGKDNTTWLKKLAQVMFLYEGKIDIEIAKALLPYIFQEDHESPGMTELAKQLMKVADEIKNKIIPNVGVAILT
jgi:hypothetical protein